MQSRGIIFRESPETTWARVDACDDAFKMKLVVVLVAVAMVTKQVIKSSQLHDFFQSLIALRHNSDSIFFLLFARLENTC